LPGKSKEEAFRIGQEMADQVTSENPRPIKLKFEKVSRYRSSLAHSLAHLDRCASSQVYLPCVLLAKKRYVGFKYERLSDLEPEFDAKGIETVRRDGIPATQKMQENCLK
jgi:DNA polymerase zeta